MYYYEGRYECFLDTADIKEVERRLNFVMKDTLFIQRYHRLECVDFYHLNIFNNRWKDDKGMFDELLGFNIVADYVLVSRDKTGIELSKGEINAALRCHLAPISFKITDIIANEPFWDKYELITEDAKNYLQSKYGFKQ